MAKRERWRGSAAIHDWSDLRQDSRPGGGLRKGGAPVALLWGGLCSVAAHWAGECELAPLTFP